MTDTTTAPAPSFESLGVPAPLVEVLAQQGKTSAFPIQVDTLPDTLTGRDVLGRGKTGSGKTLAFSIPLVARLAASGRRREKGRPHALVLAPTRELATQINAVVEPLAAAYGLRSTTIFGGVSQHRQVQALSAGVDIVVACPGRLEDLMKQGFVQLDGVDVSVLDEADHMADLGFLPVVTRIMDKTPAKGQRLLFSATLDNGVDKLVKRFLHDQVLHSVDEATSHVAAMTHHVFEVADADAKKDLVKALASGSARRILFMRTKHQAKKLAKTLTAAGIPAADLQGNLSQAARDRNLAAFSAGDIKVLVCTDVAARGVHVDGVELVIHVDPPAEHKAYLHRSGRTARAGSEGDVVTIMLPSERQDTKQLLRRAAITVTPRQVRVDDPEVVALIGEVAPYVTPSAEPVRGQSQGGQSQGANAQRKRAAREERGQGQQQGQRQQRPSAEGAGSSEGGSRRRRGGRGRGGQGAEGGQQQRVGQQRQGEQRSAAPRSSAPRNERDAQAAFAERAGQPRQQEQGTGGRRTTGRRASSAGGSGKLMVGSVVRQNGGGRRGGY